MRLRAWGLALLAIAACQGERVRPLPQRLAHTGLYADFARRVLAPGVMPFAPVYPLWSDGAQKRRWLWLPPGTTIDGRDPDAWVFPVGTRIWKEFSFDRPIETRFLELGNDGRWRYATYLWSADGRDATLAPPDGVRGAHRDAGLRFDVPGRSDCAACHESGAGPVLGLGALQLSSDRDPMAANAEIPPQGAVDAAELTRRGLLVGAPDVAVRIEAASPTARAALGYLHANCGHCHNDTGPLASLGLFLRHRCDGTGPDAVATTCGKASAFRPNRHPDGDALRVAPGRPDDSVLMLRAASRHPSLQMPPLGTSVPDPAALELLARWIREDLSVNPCPKRHDR